MPLFSLATRAWSIARSLGEALRASEERYRSVVAALSEGVVVLDASGAITFFNAAAARILGQSPKALNEKARAGAIVDEDGAPLPFERTPGALALRTGQPRRGAIVGLQRPDGSRAWLSVNAEPVRAAPGQAPSGVVLTLSDVTEQRAAERALRDRTERLRLALEASRQVEWEYDLRSQLRTMGEGFGELLQGRSISVTRAEWLQRVHPDDVGAVARALDACIGGRAPEYESEYRLRCGDGQWRWVRSRGRVMDRDDQGAPLRMVGTLADVTEVHALQEKLLAATRLSSVGTLAAGVAHEVNNPLAWVTSNLGYALDHLDELRARDELRDVLGEALQGAGRIHDIVKAMRSLGRPDPGEVGPVDVRAELLSALQIVGNQLSQRARLELDVPESLPRTLSRSTELGRVFLNLLVNAAQAIPEGQGERHRIRVAARAQGDEVRVDVSDTGQGMSQKVRERIFDAFFTTRPVGQGTGLGLPIARSIVEAAGGRIEVQSEQGRGSTFTVWLPVAGAPHASAQHSHA